MIIVIKYFVPRGFNGITLFPFIILNTNELKEDKVLIRHERIHWRQQLELLLLPFYLWYLIEFIIRWFQYRDRLEAYRNISFEREAYRNEYQHNYLNQRKWFAFLQYI